MKTTCVPLVSVIVPVYNVEKYLRQCVNSLIGQSLKEIEIILVDDGSTDSSGKICDEYASLKIVSVIHKENQGQGIARNYGIEVANGEYITFVDSDDYLESETLEYLYRKAKELELDILRYETNRFSDDSGFNAVVPPTDTIVCHRDHVELYNLAKWLFGYFPEEEKKRLFYCGSACTQIVKRSIIVGNDIRFKSERQYFSEDYLFTYDCYKCANSIGHSPSTLYHYRINDTSHSRTPNLEWMNKLHNYCQYITEMLTSDGYENEARPYAMVYFLNNSRSIIKIILRSKISLINKYKWFKKNLSNSYVSEIYREYPWRNLPLKHRLYFYFCYHQCFLPVYMLAKFQK